jgi:hypothetical protein
MKIYVASSLNNAANAVRIMNRLRGLGATITYDWTTHGRAYEESLLKSLGRAELNGVINADVVLMVQPGRSGTHVELGIAIGQIVSGVKKRILILDETEEVEKKTFYYLDCIERFSSEDEAIDSIFKEIVK